MKKLFKKIGAVLYFALEVILAVPVCIIVGAFALVLFAVYIPLSPVFYLIYSIQDKKIYKEVKANQENNPENSKEE